MDVTDLGKQLVKRIFQTRIPATPLHRLLAYEWQARHFAADELSRIFYYQPMFESRCARVGERLRLELCPDSRFPCIVNVDLSLGDDVRMSARTSFSGARRAASRPTIEVGDHSYIGHWCTLRAGTSIKIGKHCLVASHALLSGDPGHPLDADARRREAAPPESLGAITLEDDVWLAYNVTVVGNVTIGKGSVIAANAVVTKDVPPYSLVAGNPGRVLRDLRHDASVEERLATLATTLPGGQAKGRNAPRLTSSSSPEDIQRALRELYQQLFSTPQPEHP